MNAALVRKALYLQLRWKRKKATDLTNNLCSNLRNESIKFETSLRFLRRWGKLNSVILMNKAKV